jgi:hypothetical protein
LQYIAAHAPPNFTGYCPHYADGHQAETCLHHPPQCPAEGQGAIYISVECEASVKNEVWNAWHYYTGPYYGGNPGEQTGYGWC